MAVRATCLLHLTKELTGCWLPFIMEQSATVTNGEAKILCSLEYTCHQYLTEGRRGKMYILVVKAHHRNMPYAWLSILDIFGNYTWEWIAKVF